MTKRKKVRSLLRRILPEAGERGSALLVTLMVLVGLSLLGLTFVAFTETESAISVNERNSTQTLDVAEAGAKMVVEWFQDPQWAHDQGLAPLNDPTCSTAPCIKMKRQLSDSSAPTSYKYQDYYKSGTNDLLFDKSFRNNNGMFFGTEDNPDILINDKTAALFLSNLNIYLFNTTVPATMPSSASDTNPCVGCDNIDGGRITEIRIYAPPIDGGYTNGAPGWTSTAGIQGPVGSNDSFTYLGARFGVATISVTAVKYQAAQCGPFKSGCTAQASKRVKMVVSEWPIPGPGGPVQSATSLVSAGNMTIHWGKSTAEGNLNVQNYFAAIPWHDAYNIVNFERGYEIALPAGNKPNWPQLTTGSTPPSTDYKQQANWFYEMIGRSWNEGSTTTPGDLWWGARARGTICYGGGCGGGGGTYLPSGPQPYTYNLSTISTDPSQFNGNPALSCLFQGQIKSDGVYYNEVLFPHIDYDFWKQVALSGQGQSNVKYLRYVSGSKNGNAGPLFYDNSGCQQTFIQWVDVSNQNSPTCGNAQPGFYFFDTTDGLNPQNQTYPQGDLTPSIQLSGQTFQMAGFVYLNSDFSTTGEHGVYGYYNMPGEPYRDIGYYKVEDNSSDPNYKHLAKADPSMVDALGNPQPCVPVTYDASNNPTPKPPVNCVVVGAGNGQWDYQDLPWSNGGTSKDGKFNVFVTLYPNSITRNSPSSPIAANTQYFVVPWYDGCNPGDNGAAGANCSEPHEPYLNLQYPKASGGGTVADPNGTTTVKWEAPASQTRLAINLDSSNNPIACTSSSSPSDCTSNGYDKDGPVGQLKPILNGVLYMEGEDQGAGNADYFGSILIRQAFTSKGTPNVWFDEKLVKGEWPPSTMKFPRVYVSTEETTP